RAAAARLAREGGSMSDDVAARARERAQGSAVPEHWGKLLELPDAGGAGGRCWTPGRYRLVQEMQRVQPDRGADVAIFRDFDIETKNGTMHVYGVEAEPNDAPLPGEAASQLGDDEGMPF